ncbi:AAA family ATPase [Vaginisenegalia massiliensis]|uniref:AAA family ATPase n=1 Tax=Vaginisenegalia massiliensis TaxID=2058294 RepID=UPI000F5437A9|nr:AAA family ATPase [Vaginisenegalia massiliensis]
MDTVYFRLFGNPQVFLNNEPVLFSFSKINALLYYLVINQTVSRDEIAGLLWPNKSEQSAKKNLRNTIYQANKALNDEYIISPNNQILTMNKELEIHCDVDAFLNQPIEHLDLYTGEFLKGFYLKDSENFDIWIVKMRSFYEQKFVEECYRKIQEDIKLKHLNEVEKNIRRLISIDEFDERNYQLLMKYYQDHNRNGKVIETYQELVNLLKKELGIAPSKETKAIYDETIKQVNQAHLNYSKNAVSFWGRNKEIGVIESQLAVYFEGQAFKSIFLKGPMGVGKSALLDRVLEHLPNDVVLISYMCQQVEANQSLQAFKVILSKLMDHIGPNEDTFTKILSQLGDADPSSSLFIAFMEIVKSNPQLKIIMRIDDSQWLDPDSLILLNQLVLHRESLPIFFFISANTEFNSSLEDLIANGVYKHHLLTLDLGPLSFEETGHFLERQLPEIRLSKSEVDFIYHHSKGHLFFLTEYVYLLKMNMKLESLTDKMKQYCRVQLAYLTPLAKELMTMVSYFKEFAPTPLLCQLLNRDSMEVAQAIDLLIERHLLHEMTLQDEVGLAFNYDIIKEYIYDEQSASKKRIIHARIAEFMIHQLVNKTNKTLALSRIAYHFDQAKEPLKALDYELSYLQNYLRFQHDLFPIYSSDYHHLENLNHSKQKMIRVKFEHIKGQINTLKETHEFDPNYQQLILKYLYLEGRYYIRYNQYDRGIQNIQTVITKSKDSHDQEFLLRAYRQMIYYCIQTDNEVEMAKYLELAMKVAIETNNHDSIGILLRLKGLYSLMIGQYEAAKKDLVNSIMTFTITNELETKYAINIAASYDYLAEIEMNQGNYEMALKQQEQALAYCEATGVESSLVVFYVDMGVVQFANQEYQLAKDYFNKSAELYSHLTSNWKKAQLEAYMAVINMQESKFEEVERFLVDAKKEIVTDTNPRDIGMLYWAFSLIKRRRSLSNIELPLIDALLDQPLAYYEEEALRHLNPYRDQFERTLLIENQYA